MPKEFATQKEADVYLTGFESVVITDRVEDGVRVGSDITYPRKVEEDRLVDAGLLKRI